MKNVTLIGDIHQERRLNNSRFLTPYSIQVGDFGMDYTQYRHIYGTSCGPRFFIDGNHDNFSVLDPGAQEPYRVSERLEGVDKNIVHIPRGFVSGEVMFIGGALSIDKGSRKKHIDWWPEEEANYAQQNRVMSHDGRIDTIVSHDIPTTVLDHVLAECGGGHTNYNAIRSSTGTLHDMVLTHFRPKTWVFGHHHKSMQFTYGGCNFICLGIGAKINLELPLADNCFMSKF